MNTKLEKNFERLIKDIFGNSLTKDEAVAITTILNQYDIYPSDEFPLKNKEILGSIGFTFESISHILSNFEIEGEFYKPSIWRNYEYIIEHEKLWKRKKFNTLMNDIVRKLKQHPWILKLE